MHPICCKPERPVRRVSLPAAALALTLTLGACAGAQTVRGYVPDAELLGRIEPGLQTREQVARMLGSPTSISTFTDRNDTWYYITQRTSQFAFFDESVSDQRVVAIDFGPTGRVREVRNYGPEHAVAVNPVDRKTPTRGRELGFFEQLIGNVGRVAPE